MTQILVRGVSEGLLRSGKGIGTDCRLDSIVELFDVASLRKGKRWPSRCPSA